MASQPAPPPAASAPGGLTPAQLAFFEENGYLLVPAWLSPEDMAAMRASAEGVVASFEPSTVSVFSTNEQTRTSDAYFLGSGDQVRCFFEERAFGPDGALTRPKEEAINKIGHNMHELLPPFRAVSFDPRIAAVCRSLGFEKPLVVQSMYIMKNAFVGGEVKPHVDGAFLYTRPQTCVGFWWPLEDCTTSNGCLWAVPGSHRTPVRRRFRRGSDPAGPATVFEPPEPEALDTAGAVPLEIPAGTLVLLHAALVHYSEANTSDRSRHAYSIHLVEGGKGVEYPASNWLQRPGGPAAFPALYDAAGGSA